MTAMLGQIGIKVTINAVPSSDFFPKYISQGGFDLTLFAWGGANFPISGNEPLYTIPVKTVKGADVGSNFARVGTPTIDKAFNDATEILEPAKQITAGNALDKMLWQEMTILPLYQQPMIFAVKSNICNFGGQAFKSLDYLDIGFCKK